ncbi:MAG: glucose-6-phosphate isomerase [Lentisphaeria bacterium]
MYENVDFINKSPSFIDNESGFSLDITGMDLDADAVRDLLHPQTQTGMSRVHYAHQEMRRIEAGTIKNPDENRRVTHFTDRQTYPKSETYDAVEEFAGEIKDNDQIDAVVINGIGGSALGPQLLQFTCNGPYWNEMSSEERRGYPRIYFVDNTDPCGVKDVLAVIDPATTLVVSISKSGGTRETRNNMAAFEQVYAEQKVDFASNAVAVTMPESKLDKYASEQGWRKRFPMAASIGGRTSETNIVGHVPAALTGIDFAEFIGGAAHMDELTRNESVGLNPAYQLAIAWYIAGNGRGDRNMVVVPYSDRLVLLGKYLQQLVMESLGKERDLDGEVAHQGLTVYGNKGGTDAHAYIQQLNDGRDDFFATFIEPLRDAAVYEAEEALTMGDYLHGFKEGLIKALRNKNRKVIDVVIEEANARTLGMLIALYERAVAYYAELIHINAFHQPGVEAYKKASNAINDINVKLQKWLAGEKAQAGNPWWAEDIAAQLGQAADANIVTGLLNKFAVNERLFNGHKVRRSAAGDSWRYEIL